MEPPTLTVIPSRPPALSFRAAARNLRPAARSLGDAYRTERLNRT
jgi:hypothetical protein